MPIASDNRIRTEKTDNPLRRLVHKMPERNLLLALSLVVGGCCGLAAVVLKLAIKWLQTLFHGLYAGCGTWGSVVMALTPGLGMLLSLLIVRYVVRDRISHGVTRVLVAVSKNESKIPSHNCWSSLLTSAFTIGFGGSVGAEAPIVYTGAAIGSNLARSLGLSYRSMTLLLGCGAAGAVAGFFNAPLAGLLFTLEVLLFNMSMSSLLPLMVSTVSATAVSYMCLGQSQMFAFHTDPFQLASLPWYIVVGVVCALVSVYFIRVTLFLEDRLGAMKNTVLRWAVCALSLGVLIMFLPPLYGEGYESLISLAEESAVTWKAAGFFFAVLMLKVFSMTFTNAGGGVGGTFGPTLFTGALAGFTVAALSSLLLPGHGLSVPAAMLTGMAGTMAGVMQAPMTAIFLIAEISGGYELLMPLIVTSAVSYGACRIFEKYSIYAKRIANTGELLTHDSDQAVLTLLKTDELVEKDFSPVAIDYTLEQLVGVVAESSRDIFPVTDSRGRFQGYVSLEQIRRDMFRTDLYKRNHVFNYMLSAPEYVYEGESMDSVMKKFEKTGAWNLPVIKKDRTYVGFVSKSKIFSAYREELRVVSHD